MVPPPPPAPDGSVTVTADWITTPHDRIPNFGGRPTITAIASGAWSDPGVWTDGRTPTAGDIVYIPSGVAVVYDGATGGTLSLLKYSVVSVAGTLSFAGTFDTRLNVTTLVVLPTGVLFADTPSAKTEIVINDVPLLDAGQYSNGLIVLGRVTLKGAAKTPFAHLAAPPLAGQLTLSLASPAVGWKTGDRLLIADTRQQFDDNVKQIERPTIVSVSADGLTVTLTAPLVFNHYGNDPFLPHVANLTRNVAVRSEIANGVRGHCFFTASAQVDIQNVQFSGLGRTRNEETTATNVRGRYSVHFHHLHGTFRFDGNSVFCPITPMPFRWGIAIHDCSHGSVSNNVVFNWAGAGILTEQGDESENVIAGNFVCGIVGDGNRGDGGFNRAPPDYATEGTGIWLAGTDNYVRDNVVANCRKYGYNIIPPGTGVIRTPIREFARNEIYGQTISGLSIWTLGAGYVERYPIGENVVKDFKVWNIHEQGMFLYPVANLTIDGLVARNAWNQFGIAVWFGDYHAPALKIRNCDIQGFQYGIQIPDKTGDVRWTGEVEPTLVEDCYLRCRDGNIAIATMNAVTGGGASLAPRKTIIRNVKFGMPPTAETLNIYALEKLNSTNSPNFVQSDEIYVENYDRVTGDNFRVYYHAQKPEFVLPQSGPDGRIGSPEAGLTNAENWSKYGLAFAGSIAPATAVRQDGINGLVLKGE